MNGESAKTNSPRSIGRDPASALVRAAVGIAERIGVEVAVAVTDVSGHLKAFERMDGALFLAVEVATDKAWTAASSGIATHVWNASLTSEPNVVPLAHRPRLVGVGGGYPVIDDGCIDGGLGVSGDNYRQDETVAEKAPKSLGFTVQA
jgi:uncharacterized protein GlcG (DUF336 family)